MHARSIKPGFNPAALRSLNPADTDVAHALSAAGAAAIPALLDVLEASQQPGTTAHVDAIYLFTLARVSLLCFTCVHVNRIPSSRSHLLCTVCSCFVLRLV